MSSKYIDTISIMQVIGNVYNNPQLLDNTDKYNITDEDFVSDFHKIVFGSIYKIYELGANKITIETISDFLSSRPKSEAVFKQEKGEEWLIKASENALSSGFDYYYGRLKKMSLLRAYDNFGVDVSDIYDPDNIMDTKKKQLQEDFLDNSTLEEIAYKIDDRIEQIKMQYVQGITEKSVQAGEGIFELIDSLKEAPDVGVPLYGPLINTVTRGARLKKFYLRSAASGRGKSRTMVADVCYIGCNMIYDEMFGWIKNGVSEPVLFINTELELAEVQTMMLAFLSGVNESHIIDGRYEGDEEDRVREAARLLSISPIYIEEILDFSLKDIENCIRKNIREHQVKYVLFDYIQTSPKILVEISQRSGGVKLREDNVLFMLSAKLKDLANEYGIFILSGTQLNGDWRDSETPDQNLLRGAKSIADRIDLGMILLEVSQEDVESLQTILSANTFAKPNLKISVYKNRRGQYKSIYLWCNADLGTCRVKPMFATTWNYELISMEDLKILTEEPSAF